MGSYQASIHNRITASCPLTGALVHCVLYVIHMSSIIPDGISTADLQALAKEAPASVNADKKAMTEVKK